MKYLLEYPVRGIIGSDRFLTSIHWRNGMLITDEPEKLGGRDLGPDPYTLLLSSLISCTLATLRMYADHKAIPLPEIEVTANMYQRIGNDGTVMQIEREIVIPGSADEELRQRLIRIAESCPVSRILKGNIRISTSLRDGETTEAMAPAVRDRETD
ncbi:OsmC family protein [Mucilaginibacter defluvii]|uniref:OsmC family protein n=1 Tax=Mucilaginibacter defluvii TaxID=1196019 RepID=A0ABP9FVG6_9SPHI